MAVNFFYRFINNFSTDSDWTQFGTHNIYFPVGSECDRTVL